MSYQLETMCRRLGYARESRRRAARYALVGTLLLLAGVAVVGLSPWPLAGSPLIGFGVGLLTGTLHPLASARRWERLAETPDYTPSSW